MSNLYENEIYNSKTVIYKLLIIRDLDHLEIGIFFKHSDICRVIH